MEILKFNEKKNSSLFLDSKLKDLKRNPITDALFARTRYMIVVMLITVVMSISQYAVLI